MFWKLKERLWEPDPTQVVGEAKPYLRTSLKTVRDASESLTLVSNKDRDFLDSVVSCLDYHEFLNVYYTAAVSPVSRLMDIHLVPLW